MAMKALIVRTVTGLFVAAAAAYVLVALALVASDRPQAEAGEDGAIDFATAVAADYSDLPELTQFLARDGAGLSYRRYGDPATAERIVVLVHGSGWHGMQFHTLAGFLSKDGSNAVIVPDLRGHGVSPLRRGDVDHIGQLEEDLADLIDHVSASAPGLPVIVGGHSSGGGLVVRFAGGEHGSRADGFILLAPFLKHDAPTTRPNSGGWADAATRRIIGLVMLNAVGVTPREPPVRRRSSARGSGRHACPRRSCHGRRDRPCVPAVPSPTTAPAAARSSRHPRRA